ncbi:MAG: 23S rRNA (pseudouridine(1915)-N(3))-methyltransferase RlmH [Acidaminococcales bacterium]|jgi:23S rRNA (pseudouridine1915-N3)-methyltransferase|nr:23S rRNA (pseudouridine(1915)-N(3))-methyltransferase RlmH [Acidaminococcales bacterium]
MKVNIIAVGGLKETYLRAAADEYVKRLRPYCSLSIAECPEEKAPAKPSAAGRGRALDKEGEMLLAQVKDGDFTIALDVGGGKMSSEEFSGLLAQETRSGDGRVVFLIGGAYGLSDKVRQTADFLLSLSDFTFTHQIARLLLLEQIYRAFKIMNREKYHN